MAQIYIAFVDTPGFFAGIIRRTIRQKYIHVAVGLDPYLEEAYSIGRRHPSVPLIAGFEKEDKRKILRAFPDADYMVCSMECTAEQKKYIENELREAMKRRFSYHYAVLGLPFILMNRPFLSEESLYMFVVHREASGRGRRMQMGKALFACHAKRFLRIQGQAENF